jgi:hypothetical protein
MHPDDEARLLERLLLDGDVDVEVRVKIVEGSEIDAGKRAQRVCQCAVRPGSARVRVRVNDADHGIAG